MSLNHSANESSPRILSGPFGSLLNDHYNISTQAAFRQQKFDWIKNALAAYRDGGVTQPVTPTFGAAARGVDGGRFTDELLEWNQLAVQFTREEFSGREPFASVAALLNTSDHKNADWFAKSVRHDRATRIHTPQVEALREAGILHGLGEAFHDMDDAGGFVTAAKNAGMRQLIVSFEPTERGVPNSTNGVGSYREVLERLQDLSHGKIDVCIGLNCGNADQILDLVASSGAGTLSAVYPNHSVIPHNEEGDRFRALGDLNDQRTPEQNIEFGILRRRFEITDEQLAKLVTLGGELNIPYIGLCCGAAPKDTAALSRRVRDSMLVADPQ